MKKLAYLFFALMIVSGTAFSQIINPKETAKRKANDRINNGIDRNIDKGLDKIEEGIGSIFKKKDKKTKKSADEDSEEEVVDNKTKTKKKSSESEEEMNEEADASASNKATAKASTKISMKSYSKFDFIPGEKVIAEEDFSQDAIGDFPAKWNTNASGEIVSVEGNSFKWLQFPTQGVFYPEFINELPDNFTIEFDMMISEEFDNNGSGLKVIFPELSQRNAGYDQHFNGEARTNFDIHPLPEGKGISYAWVIDNKNTKTLDNSNEISWNVGEPNRISIWRQKNRIRLYINELKIWDLPRAFITDVKYSLLFATYTNGGLPYITNLRVAVGAPDTRNKLLTEGKLVTRGILFDINSDKLKPESYGVLKEIGTVLKENPTLKVKIIGHTDSDGDDAKNLDLSKRRAAAVKTALSTEFGIAASQMETDGKGESEPSEPNNTAQGKANNRRVEFIKL
ncbi:OmpA family protein [Emticicia sp. BO119]|uniref:OmpA family protein n=1 Tax=Emticicia sp. BO119 TaxID=2757768 RepID=UPI0015F0F9EA|nr:OmpA family protein [Emticicia sp. BO119]MBA4848951.1 OmpA family protein [Emticicia sp. BO119]